MSHSALKRHGLQLRARLRYLYHGERPAAVKFRLGVLVIDFAIIAFFIAAPILKEHGRTFYTLDYAIAALLALDLAARITAYSDWKDWFRRPINWVDVVVLATLLFPAWLFNFGFLRILRLWTLVNSDLFWRTIGRRYDNTRVEDVTRALAALVTFVFVVTGFVYTVFRGRHDGITGYLDALYFTVATLTTTGFGDITLPGAGGRILSIAVMLCGITLFLNLAQTLLRPHKVNRVCTGCGLNRHDADAQHCKSCGTSLEQAEPSQTRAAPITAIHQGPRRDAKPHPNNAGPNRAGPNRTGLLAAAQSLRSRPFTEDPTMIRTMACAAALLAATGATSSSMAQTSSPASSSAAHRPANPPIPEGGFATSDATDPYLWLEEVDGARAMAWVNTQNTRTLGILQGDARYESLHQQALDIVQSKDRIPGAGFNRDGTVDNFWQDADHVRGVWRRATLASYKTATPEWRTILDVDALSAAEGKNWVYKGVTCLQPAERLCLVSLSDGGKDAVVVREFDSATGTFVDGGFSLPESKGGASWVDADTLLIARDFGPGTLTSSGYPMIVKQLKRGQSIDQATTVFTGQPTDVSVSGSTLRDADGAIKAVLINRGVSFYESETYRLNADGTTTRLELPAKSDIDALVAGQLVVTTKQDWTAPSGQAFKTGDVIAWNLDAWLADPKAPATLVIRPTERQSVESISSTRNTLVLSLFDNVRGSVQVYNPADWSHTALDLPRNVTVGIGSTSDQDDSLFVSVAGYLTPSSLYLADAATGAAEVIKSLPAKFDATGMTVDQFEATSADGTKIPYFVVHKDAMPMDGSNPTLLYGYGGFQNSLLPGYSATVGKLWLERGGVYVVANTRGGGEFGPRWHEAALQENRYKAHEDFQAVALDLEARRITSQPKLGIMGGSQGGLFMGAMLTQRPDLINAAVIQVPLFDMLRFNKLLAGASWQGEYGNPDIPAERAWIQDYSPYQNLRAGMNYPEVFIHTSTKDDRVHPGHARKAAARLEELGYPVLFYENTDGGHAAGANLRETARRLALEYTYLSRRLMDQPAQQ